MKPKSLTIIVPVYEDCRAFKHLLADIKTHVGRDVFIVAVDDGSLREPVQVELILEAGLDGIVLQLIRNVGHQSAIAIGMNYVAENMPPKSVVVMDSDGEDSPKAINDLVDSLKHEEVDVAVAQRRARREPLSFQLFYFFYKRFFRLLAGRDLGFGNFMAINGKALRRLSAMSESWIHVAAAVIASKLRIHRVPVDRERRYAGHSKMNFVSLALHGLKALMVFSEDVLVRTGTFVAYIISAVILVTSIAGGLKLAGYATPGWLTSVFSFSLIVVLQVAALTLTSLLIAGVIKTTLLNLPDYRKFIDVVIRAEDKSAAAAKKSDLEKVSGG